MIVIRFLVLTFLAFYGWSMGQIPGGELNAFGSLVALSFFVTAPALYLLPSIEAWLRKCPNLASVAVVNLLLGWTVVGWVVAAAWALKKTEASQPGTSAPNQGSDGSAKEATKSTRDCPYCAEEIMAAAIKCKHCGSALD